MGDRTGAAWTASVVVPAHDEAHALPRLLAGLLDQRIGDITLEVAVVVNGSTDGSAAVARSYADRFAGAGHRLTVAEIPERSKAWALNEGDRLVSAFPRLYLDADIELSPDAIRRTVEELVATDRPMLAAPRLQVAESPSAATRHYGRLWSELPYVRSHVPGVGFYAVNEAGRRRWWRFPTRIGADDKFVRLHFDRSEAKIIDDASFTVFMPERLGELLRVRGRWTSLNREIVRNCPGLDRRDRSRWMSSARHIASNTSSWADAPAFLAVWSGGWGWSMLRTWGVGERWSRAASSPMRAPQRTASSSPTTDGPPLEVVVAPPVTIGPVGPPEAPPATDRVDRGVHVAIVTYNSLSTVGRCLESLLASEDLDDLRITVVDNASSDGGAEVMAATFPAAEVIGNRRNVGFATAVNQAFAGTDSRWLAVVTPDVEVRPETLAATIDHLEQRPGVGSCGVPSVHPDGTVNDRSFFMRPSVWSEITRALGAHRIAKASRLLNPEQDVAHIPLADAPLGVDVIAGCFNVIDRELFEHLNGYDEAYFLCGEDLDLSVRAVEAGASPEVVPVDPIVHHSASSFSSSADARVAYLRGRSQYQRRWWSGRRAAIARSIRWMAIAGRLVILRALRSNREQELALLWDRRHEWADPVVPASV